MIPVPSTDEKTPCLHHHHPRFDMKTHGEIESAICEGVTRFEQDYMGRGPKDIHTHLLGDLLVVRLQGVLTAAEQQLVKSLSADKGRDLLKQVRTHLIETARPVMEAMVQEITGVKVLSLHHDISTATGEEVVLFTLAESPILRDGKKQPVLKPDPRNVLICLIACPRFPPFLAKIVRGTASLQPSAPQSAPRVAGGPGRPDRTCRRTGRWCPSRWPAARSPRA